MVDTSATLASTKTVQELSEALIISQKQGLLSKFSTGLASLYLGLDKALPNAAANSTGESSNPLSVRAVDGYVTIDAIASDRDGASLLKQLVAIGLEDGASFGALAGGRLPVSALAKLLDVTTLGFVSEAFAQSNAGLVTTQADIAMKADVARATFGFTGSGVTVGVISDSFDVSKKGTMAGDIASDDLPAATEILQDATGNADEGRAMAQLIHDLAPGAAIKFATAFISKASFASNIELLASKGAKIIVDDITYFNELMFQDDVVAQAVDKVNAAGVTFFTSAGNRGILGYEGDFVAGTGFTFNGVTYSSSQQFDLGSNLLKLNTKSNDFRIVFQWDSPGASAGGKGATNDLDIFLTDAAGNVRTYSNGTPQASTNNNIGNDPTEIVGVVGGSDTAHYIKVGVKQGSELPTKLKMVIYDSTQSMTISPASTDINDSTIYGHHAAVGAIAVGAAKYTQSPALGVASPIIESFSSGGPTTILFDTAGNRLATPSVRELAFIATDGGNTTFFGSDDSDPDTFPNFYGTSAAAPDAAAVAALMLQARSTLTPTDIRNLLQNSAIDLNDPRTAGPDPGFDANTGAGLIQADTAVKYAKDLVFTADATHLRLVGSHLDDLFVVTDKSVHTLNGVQGTDTVDYSALTEGIVIKLSGATPSTVKVGQLSTDIVSNIENVVGGQGNNELTGDTLANNLKGLGGSDTVTGAGGDDALDGGGGSDTAIFSGARSEYTVSESSGVVTVADKTTGRDGTDTLKNFELFKFSDKTYTLAELVGPPAGSTFRSAPRPTVSRKLVES